MGLSAFHIDVVKGGDHPAGRRCSTWRARASSRRGAHERRDPRASRASPRPSPAFTPSATSRLALGARPRPRPDRRERRRQVDADEHRRRRRPAGQPARCAWPARPTRPPTRPMPRSRGIAFIHQELNLFTNLTIAENIFIDGFPRRARPLRSSTARRVADTHARAAREVDLDLAPDTPVDAALAGRAPAGRGRQGAAARRRHHHLRRADHLAHRARDRAAVRADRTAARGRARR